MPDASLINASETKSRRFGLPDVVMILFVCGVFMGIISVGKEWTQPIAQKVVIEQSLAALPLYALYSLSRGLFAFALSLIFSLLVGYWAAHDRRAERVIVPILDVLQSIPVLGFLPGFVLTMVALFPNSNIGLEIAAVLMIFTAQVWNLTFSFYQSLKTVPAEFREVAAVYRYSTSQRIRWIEIPHSMTGLVWNSMISVASGWFFLTVNESFRLGDRDFRLPGVGSYMAEAIANNNRTAMIAAVVAMTGIIIFLDQLLWRPLLCWSRKFRSSDAPADTDVRSWFLNFLVESRFLSWIESFFDRPRAVAPVPAAPRAPARAAAALPWLLYIIFVAGIAAGVWRMVELLQNVSFGEWIHVFSRGSFTLTRVLAATLLSTLWALPVGIAIGLRPRVARALGPWIQIASSFPAPMIFPLVVAMFQWFGMTIQTGSVLLMMLGAQWYILFNVIAGAASVPSEFRELGRVYRFKRMQRWTAVYLPAVFPYLLTGWVTAVGGAWNASIVSEYFIDRGKTLVADGLGATVSVAAEKAQFPLLAASVIVMAGIVLLWNGTVWHACFKLSARKFSIEK
ncbi:MAG: ABC transporter permease subunit [Planctomycetes bacterium]|nr:ABC transporter permease subunit [Planctomycetota bacterium]